MTKRTIKELNEEIESLKAALAGEKEEKNKYEAIISAIGDGIIIQDTDYKIIYQNKIQNELFGDKKGEKCYRTYEGKETICEGCPVERTFIDGKIHTSERKLIRGDRISYYELTSSPLRDTGGKIIGGVKIVRDITSRKQADDEKNRFHRAIGASTNGISIADKNDVFIYVNEAYARMFGYEQKDLIGKTWREIAPSEIILSAEKSMTEALHNRKIGSFRGEFPGLRKDGSTFPTDVIATALWDEKGNYEGHVCIVNDITERKLTEDILRKNEEKYRQLVETLTEGIWVIDKDAYTTFVNPRMAQMLGYEVDEMIGKHLFFFMDEEWRKKAERNLERRKQNIKEQHDFEFIKKDGTRIYTSLETCALNDENGNYSGAIAAIADITERRHFVEMLHESEQFLENIFSSIQDGIGVIDTDMNIIRINKTAELWYPHSFPFIGKKCYEAFHNRKAPCEICPAQETLRTGRSAQRIIQKHGSKGEQQGWLEIHTFPFYDISTERMKGAIEYVRDITERKRVEEELRQSEEKYRLLIENMQEGVYIVQDQKMHFVNQAILDITGYSMEEMMGRNFLDFIAPEDREMMKDRYFRRQKGENVPNSYEFHILRKDGKKIIVDMNIGLVTYRGRIASMGIIRDITARKKAEKALLESETRYRTLFETAGDAIFIVEGEGKKKGNIVDANKTAARMHGYSIDELLKMKITDLDTEESAGDVHATIQMILNGETVKKELDHRKKDGTVFPVEIKANLLEIGGHKYIIAFDRDITERKRAEEALSLSNLVVENSPTVLFRWKAEAGWPVEFVSKNIVQFGYTPQDFLSNGLPYASIIYPDDLERITTEVNDHVKRGEDRFQQEYRIMTKNGDVRWIDDRTVIERDRDGQITHYQGIIIDITGRKKAEKAIKKYNLELEESNLTKELFIDIMHHDLLNPLNVANGYVELFLEEETDTRKKSFLEAVHRNLIKGMMLIDNATKYSRLESMKNIQFEELDLRTVINETIENLSPLAKVAGMIIENDLKHKMMTNANNIIEDVFANIISNAIKYASGGKKIIVEGRSSEKNWIIRIIDFGPGIRDPDKKQIFERFRRKEKMGVKGSGLGLAIAGKIIELHRGRLWVEDNPEGGAIFVVDIPKY